MSSNDPLGLGMIGCGAVGLFCLDAFSRVQGVRIVAVADAHGSARRHEPARCRPPNSSSYASPCW